MSKYNYTSILCDQEVIFTDKQREGVEKFHKSRIAFAIKGGQLLLNCYDEREHRVYLKEDWNIDDDEFETLIRGYIKKGRIAFYITSHHSPITPWSDKILSDGVLLVASNSFGSGEYEIWNGVIVGEPGEEWPAYYIIGKVEL
jgi:hypothetical protein